MADSHPSSLSATHGKSVGSLRQFYSCHIQFNWSCNRRGVRPLYLNSPVTLLLYRSPPQTVVSRQRNSQLCSTKPINLRLWLYWNNDNQHGMSANIHFGEGTGGTKNGNIVSYFKRKNILEVFCGGWNLSGKLKVEINHRLMYCCEYRNVWEYKPAFQTCTIFDFISRTNSKWKRAFEVRC